MQKRGKSPFNLIKDQVCTIRVNKTIFQALRAEYGGVQAFVDKFIESRHSFEEIHPIVLPSNVRLIQNEMEKLRKQVRNIEKMLANLE